LIKTPYRGWGEGRAWEIQIAADANGESVVWASRLLSESDRVTIGTETGRFVGPLAGQQLLRPASTYYARVRQQSDAGQWSAWSSWHQPFSTVP
jgi:hypothetical protein